MSAVREKGNDTGVCVCVYVYIYIYICILIFMQRNDETSRIKRCAVLE
jgi:hypothetical protein